MMFPETNSISIPGLTTYYHYLIGEEKSPTTITKYLRDLQKFLTYTAGRPITKELVITYKEELKQQYATASINSMLASLNHYFDFAGLYECKVKQIKQQRRVYCPEEKELSKEEYYRLIKAAQELQKDRLSLIIQTITYIKKQHIRQGPIFITKQGNPINRSNVWREMKNLCEIAHVRENKVFPHNLRHLFAKTYYKMEKDISKLADLLGHSSINTTRIYIISSGEEHRRQIDRMKLLL